MYWNPTVPTIPVNVNGVNTTIERQKVSNWIDRYVQYICYIWEAHFKYKDAQ